MSRSDTDTYSTAVLADALEQIYRDAWGHNAIRVENYSFMLHSARRLRELEAELKAIKGGTS